MKKLSVMALLITAFISLFSSGYTVSHLCDSTSEYVVKAAFPVFEGEGSAKVNSDIKSVISEKFNAEVNEMKSMPKDDQLNLVPYSETTCSIFASNDYFVSVLFYNESFTGGAHPSHVYFSYNYDFNLDKAVKLQDAGWPASFLSKLSAYCIKDVKSQLAKKEINDTASLADAIKPEYSTFDVFNVTEEGMYITFNEYKVAPYYIGAVTVHIPNSEVEKMIK